MLNIALFGPPGAGKGTQSIELRNKYGLIHISTGELFRQHIQQGTSLGLSIQKYIAEGNLVPDEISIDIIDEQIRSNIKKCNGFLFDGFPRTINQALVLDQKLNEFKMKLSVVISLDVEKHELTKRIKKRSKELNRIDDQDDQKVLTRFEIYHTQTLPIAEFYRKQNKFFHVSGQDSVDIVSQRLSNIIEQYI